MKGQDGQAGEFSWLSALGKNQEDAEEKVVGPRRT